MAIAVVLDFPGASPEGYDRVLRRIGVGDDGLAAPGALFHWVAPTATGIRVVDVWCDRDEAEEFVRDRLAPAALACGLTEPPDVEVLELHRYLRGPDARAAATPDGGRPAG